MHNRVTVRALAIAGLVAGGLVMPATAAQATPSNCTGKHWQGSDDRDGWQATCNTLTNPPHDEWRAIAYCIRDTNPSIRVTVYGPWTGGIGKWSVARCAANYSDNGGSLQTRVNYP